MDEEIQYIEQRTVARELYNRFVSIYSPALNRTVYFSAEGFAHVVYKGSRKERHRSDQIGRFKPLSRMYKLIGLATTYQEYEEIFRNYWGKKHKKSVYTSGLTVYWGIIAIIDGRKIKVILRSSGKDGKVQFWSVVPAWTTTKFRDIKFFNTMEGNPEED